MLDDMQEPLERSPDAMRIRRCSVEHPFGTIKSWMEATYFLHSLGLKQTVAGADMVESTNNLYGRLPHLARIGQP